MCEARESEAPVYSLTYQPSKQDIRHAADALHRRRPRRWADNRIHFIIQGVLLALTVVIVICMSIAAIQTQWTRGLTGSLVFLLLENAIGIANCFRAVYWPESIKDYMRDRKGDAGRTQTYMFYNDRVEIEDPSGRLTHAYAAYDQLILTPDFFFLLLFEYRGEHLPWSVVPAGQREAFLLDRAAAYEIPVEDRKNRDRRKSK